MDGWVIREFCVGGCGWVGIPVPLAVFFCLLMLLKHATAAVGTFVHGGWVGGWMDG